MGRLIKEALFNPKRAQEHAARQARRAYMMGDLGTAHSLEPIIGTSYSRDIYQEFAEGIRRVDPSGEKAFLLAAEMKGDYDPKTRILKTKTT